jgi:P4 family phage/plasmid primase-like protien
MNETDVETTAQDAAVSLNLSDIEQYFRFLDPNPKAIHCYGWFPGSGKGVIEGLGVRHGNTDKILNDVRMILNAPETAGATLHAVLNQTKVGGGRKRADIESVRVFCLDIDNPVSRERIIEIIKESAAQLVVQSSPGKYHLYWACSPTVGVLEWDAVQCGIAAKYGGDRALNRPEHMMRVPGVTRTCKDGAVWVPVIERLTDRVEMDLSKIFEQFGADIIEIGETAGKELIKERKKGSKAVEKYLDGLSHGGTVGTDISAIASTIKVGSRNESLYQLTNDFVFKRGFNCSAPLTTLEEAVEFAVALDEALQAPLYLEEGGLQEVMDLAKSAWERAGAALSERAEKKAAEVEAIEEGSETAQQIQHPTDPLLANFASTEFLKVAPYGERAIISRVLSRFGHCIIRTGEFRYAFDLCEKVWRRQKLTGEMETIRKFCELAILDTMREPNFIKKHCADRKGKVHEKTVEEKKEAFSSNYKIRSTASEVFENADLRRMNINLFDNNPYAFYTSNGVLDIRTGKNEEAKPQDYLWKRTSVAWDEEAECPYWLNFLTEIFTPPGATTAKEIAENNKFAEQMVQFMQEVFGYSLTGLVSEQTVFVHTGEGSNGKSTLLEVLEKLGDGEGYSSLLDCQALLKKKNTVQSAFDRLGPKIEGKRIIIIDDLESEKQWNEGFIKSLTAKKIPCRNLYHEQRDIPNRSKFHIGCNEVPHPETENHAIERRICIITYPNRFKVDTIKGEELERETTRELSGILRWAVAGVQRMIKENRGIKYPESVDSSIKEYVKEHFKIEDVVNRCFELVFEPENAGPDEKISLRRLVDVVNTELKSRGPFPQLVNELHLGRLLMAKGFKSERVNEGTLKVRYYYVKLVNLNKNALGPVDSVL